MPQLKKEQREKPKAKSHQKQHKNPQKKTASKVTQNKPRQVNKMDKIDRALITESRSGLASLDLAATKLQNRTGNKTTKSSVLSYVECLCDPKRAMTRIPDGDPRQTAVVRSINEYNLAVSTDQYTEGRFSLCARPVLGDTSAPTSYQLGIADVSAISNNKIAWKDVDWSDPSSYVSNPQFGADPRLDINSAVLTSASPVSFGGTVSDNLSPYNLLFGTFAPLTTNLGNALVIKPTSLNLNGNAVSGYAFVLPYGDWVISLAIKANFSNTPAGNSVTLGMAGFGMSKSVTLIGIQNPQTSVTSTGVAYNVTAIFNVQSNRGSNYFNPVLLDGNGSMATNVAVNSSFFQANSSAFAGTISNDSGPAQEIRPVAMSILVSFVGSSLNNGGQISSAFVPSELITNNFYSQGLSGAGQLQFEENVRRLDRSYNGPLKMGTYAVWTPYDPSDIAFRPPSQSNANPFPGIIVSGVFTPDATVQVSTLINLRVELCVCYEFVTKSTDRELVNYPGSQQILDLSWSLMKSEVQCRGNGEHLLWLKAMYQKIRKFAVENQHILIPLAKATLMATGL